MRPGEPIALRTSRVIRPFDRRLGGAGSDEWGLSLWATKTKRYDYVRVRRGTAAYVLRLALQRAKRLRRSRLFGLSYRTYLKQFKAAAANIGLP